MRSSQLSETLLPKKLAMPSPAGPAVLGRLCHRRDSAHPEPGWAPISAPCVVCGGRHCRPSGSGDRVLPANLPGVPERRRRLHCRPRQPRGVGRAGGCQRAAGRLRAHGRRIRRRGSCSDHIGHSRTIPARRLHVGWLCGAAHSHEPARRQRVREGVCRPHLRLPTRHLRHVRSRRLPAAVWGAPAGTHCRTAHLPRALIRRHCCGCCWRCGHSPRAAPP